MKEAIKQTISYSREVCICPICKAKHNKKIKGTKIESKLEQIRKDESCVNLNGSFCRINNMNCGRILNKDFYECTNHS